MTDFLVEVARGPTKDSRGSDSEECAGDVKGLSFCSACTLPTALDWLNEGFGLRFRCEGLGDLDAEEEESCRCDLGLCTLRLR